MNIINELSDNDIGKTVYYMPNHARNDKSQWERGRIKSFNNELKVAWVVYDNGNDAVVEHYDRYTAARTDFADLAWSKS